MQIRELAARSGLAADTLRFYERSGLLDGRHVVRAANGYRSYTSAAVERVAQIRQAQAAGFTLREVAEVLAAFDGGRLTPAAVRGYCARKLADVESRIAALQRLRRYLKAKVEGVAADPPPRGEMSSSSRTSGGRRAQRQRAGIARQGATGEPRRGRGPHPPARR